MVDFSTLVYDPCRAGYICPLCSAIALSDRTMRHWKVGGTGTRGEAEATEIPQLFAMLGGHRCLSTADSNQELPATHAGNLRGLVFTQLW